MLKSSSYTVAAEMCGVWMLRLLFRFWLKSFDFCTGCDSSVRKLIDSYILFPLKIWPSAKSPKPVGRSANFPKHLPKLALIYKNLAQTLLKLAHLSSRKCPNFACYETNLHHIRGEFD